MSACQHTPRVRRGDEGSFIDAVWVFGDIHPTGDGNSNNYDEGGSAHWWTRQNNSPHHLASIWRLPGKVHPYIKKSQRPLRKVEVHETLKGTRSLALGMKEIIQKTVDSVY